MSPARGARSEGVRLTALRCGALDWPAADVLPAADELPTAGVVRLVVWAFLVEHPAGTVLFDAGMHPVVRDDPSARLGAVDGVEVICAAGDDVEARVAAAGVDPSSVERVVASHLHFDHVGGLGLLPDARLLVQRREWAHAGRGDVGIDDGYVDADYHTGQDVELVDGDHDLFGDGTVECVPTPGHTPGHQSLRVRTGGREVLLASDACMLAAHLSRDVVPAFGGDPVAQRAVFESFRRARRRGALVVFGHDELPADCDGVVAAAPSP